MSWRERAFVLLLAAALTLSNAVKPAVVDDTAYLEFARHLSANPTDPYGFRLFWYDRPEPAMHVLLPPVLSYWVAGGMRLVGENLFLLKVWLFPFAWILALAVFVLMRRFAPASARVGTTVFVLSPAVLPLFNVMLDVPALALGLTGLSVFVRGCDRRQVDWVVLAGALVGLAMQTKYSMLVTPVVVVWYGVLHRRWADTLVAVAVAAGLFAGWEWCLHRKYGESHFLYHLRSHSETKDFAEQLAEKAGLVRPLLSHFGLLAAGVAFWASVAAGFNRTARWVAVGVFAVLVGLAVLPTESYGSHTRELLFATVGVSALVTLARVAWRLMRKTDVEPLDLAFLVGWIAIEAMACVALTPFAAARRVMGVSAAAAVLAAVGTARFGTPRGLAAVAVGLGIAVAALDWYDAFPEKDLADQAAVVANPEDGGTVWFHGHWAFQFYCTRAGMAAVVPGESVLRAGDRLVYPLPPDGLTERDFYRPHHGFAFLKPDPERTELLTVLTWDDPVPLTTLPSLYGGGLPLRGRSGPRMRVGVYRVTADWQP
jgi:hypothetical protein